MGVFAALPSADAMLDAERAASPVHVESPEHRTCASQHSHLFCQIVRSLLSGVPSGHVANAENPAPAVFAPQSPGVDLPARGAIFLIGAIVPRAPPFA